MAVYSMMFLGMVPFGSLLAGTLADHLGAPATVAIGGTACITAAWSSGCVCRRWDARQGRSSSRSRPQTASLPRE